jgi:hypothetical protein
MEIKISEDKLDYLKDVVFDGLDIDKYDSFQSRSITSTSYRIFNTWN